jgi:hypothetical protein
LVQTDDAAGNRSFSADLHGDPTPVFLPQYAAFFGHEVSLQAKGQRAADGALTLDSLEVKAQALTLHGNMAIAADGQPQSLNFTGALGWADQSVSARASARESWWHRVSDAAGPWVLPMGRAWPRARTMRTASETGWARTAVL